MDLAAQTFESPSPFQKNKHPKIKQKHLKVYLLQHIPSHQKNIVVQEKQLNDPRKNSFCPPIQLKKTCFLTKNTIPLSQLSRT